MALIAMATFSQKAANAQLQQPALEDVQQILTLVNDEVITLYDLRQRVILLALASGRLTDMSTEEQQFLQAQAMNALIDDRLKLQEAAEYDLKVDNLMLEQAFVNYARQFNVTGEELETTLGQLGVQKSAMIERINGTLAWRDLTAGLLEPMVNITDDEVYNYIENLENNKGKDEYQVSEIFILVSDNERREESMTTATAISDQLKEGAPFNAMAQQFSESSTASVGGDLGWVMENAIPSEVREQIITMEVNEVSDPVVTEDGIYILQVTDKRKILTLTDNDIEVDISHIAYEKKEETAEEFAALKAKIDPILTNSNNCELLTENADKTGAVTAGEIGQITVGDLPDEIRDEILTMEIGQATSLLNEADGYRVFVLCGKNIPVIEAPDFEEVLFNLTQTRVQLLAKRHLRDLRRDAIIDYR